jgi:uncharacterized protein YbaR (Trm112 family)
MTTPHWFSRLACPITHDALRYDEKQQVLISEKTNKAYPIRDGIPILLAEEAITWPTEIASSATSA